MFNPVATYRIQFHKKFNFTDFEKIIPYLQKLGVKTVYASPIFEAVPGSMHGYDVINPHRINPEIGTDSQLRNISKTLREAGISWLQDIVPNHMAYHPENIWLMDVLEKGRNSVYESFFDQAWSSELFHGRLTVPILGASLEDVLFNQELQVTRAEQRLVFKYYDNAYPLHPRSYTSILQSADMPDAINLFISQIDELHTIEEPVAYTLRWHELILQLDALTRREDMLEYIEQRILAVNDDKELLRTVAAEQNYVFNAWHQTDERITFRRFFTVNELIGLNMQYEKVFEHYHMLIKTYVEDGIFQGLRLDHIDGLYDPTQYLERLRALVGEDTYIVAEKILQLNEDLPAWPIQGTTGYEFLAWVNNLLTPPESEKPLSAFYSTVVPDDPAIRGQVRAKKANILFRHMVGELNNLSGFLLELNLIPKERREQVSTEDLKSCLAELLIRFPTYRAYSNKVPLAPADEHQLRALFQEIQQDLPQLAPAVGLLEQALLEATKEGDEEYNIRAIRFFLRCMQFAGPLMAKGVEDTLMYTYNRFLGHNDVGDSPEYFGLPVEAFHNIMRHRQEAWPLALNATSTHDTKRGEDVRARLNGLAALAGDWVEAVRTWQKQNAALREKGCPDANDEYFIYQTLIGAQSSDAQFPERLEAYFTKAFREAKRRTDWAAPDEAYEEAVKEFTTGLLAKQGAWQKSFRTFSARVAEAGIQNTLSQVLLKFTCPGVPDVYQGCELWDLSLVDPDNRRPVDYHHRLTRLEALEEIAAKDPAGIWSQLWQDRHDAGIKLWLTACLFRERSASAEVFSHGEYIPLVVEGIHRNRVIAFARKYKKTQYIVIAPLYATDKPVDWQDTRVQLPPNAPETWLNVFTREKKKQPKYIEVKEVLAICPVGLLSASAPPSSRSAGIILHITSLPSVFGIGDLGPQAYSFADFLYRAHQTVWQLLPLNPTSQSSDESPYSAYSAMAGNPWLISPELLAEDGLLTPDELAASQVSATAAIDFATVKKIKQPLYDRAWTRFKTGDYPALHKELDAFVKTQAAWLNDFSAYEALREHQHEKSWASWPQEFRTRDPQALQQFCQAHTDRLDKTRWLQFIVDRQWKRLKSYCRSLDIRFLGDIPFYMSYDSSDVWANPTLFGLDDQLRPQYIAGVPPDYFNDQGQLWGMPVYCWDKLKESGYTWWIDRLRKNIELYDQVRLDHFRAFESYWEVPADAETAVGGKWQKGPGADFFHTIGHALGKLPFVAEDLGEITEDVYALRDAFGFPGMKVLQFAFGEELPSSPYAPHNFENTNFIVYTGTHDNDTTRGWFTNLDAAVRKTVVEYTATVTDVNTVSSALVRLAHASIAQTAIIPMQDILGLASDARMNTPGSVGANWRWRMEPHAITAATEESLRMLTKYYNRG
ncbi:malto-oligosyltrehalose synthase [Fulvivirgaceae bacterium PWU5]|uniref:4-alpha-glucanotransferase n=1 Tax=Dawidia cretensis TaxID=2782350 RepID=A0AAP2GUH3_9BACT|nr:malto-oligosyltrehalose synthase [Dawidia cretensis]MBT1707547.1 malto-oligosyltrehalose synthase [Dawidia cretensis]